MRFSERSELELPVAGAFEAIGHTPNTSFLKGQLTTTEQGYIKTEPGSTGTNIEGVFAAGSSSAARDIPDSILHAGAAAAQAAAYVESSRAKR